VNWLRHFGRSGGLMVPKTTIEAVPFVDRTVLQVVRGRHVEELVTIGPNEVHAAIIHADGSITDLGVSHNLLNTDGRDLIAAGMGAAGVNNGSNVATATSATSLTDSGEAWTTDQFKGWIVVAEEGTNTPVFGNVGSNTGTVLTIDAWKNADDSAGTTPGSTCNYFIIPACRPRYMGLTENASAAAAGNTALTGEITTGGCSRALCTYAHTNDAATFTLQKAFSVTASFPAIHRMGLFTASNTTAAGIMVFESVLNADANVVNGDTLTVTDTVTLS
jgi:hypothetical protein